MSFYTLTELLQRHKKDFADFDIRDIQYQPSSIFLHREIGLIINCPRAEQFDKMIFTCKYHKPQTVEIRKNFIKCLKFDYDWLADLLEQTIVRENKGVGDHAIEEYRAARFASDIPRTGDLFVYRTDFVSISLPRMYKIFSYSY